MDFLLFQAGKGFKYLWKTATTKEEKQFSQESQVNNKRQSEGKFYLINKTFKLLFFIILLLLLYFFYVIQM